MMRALCDAFNMGTEKLKRVSGLVDVTVHVFVN
jgi:hypothetical protein